MTRKFMFCCYFVTLLAAIFLPVSALNPFPIQARWYTNPSRAPWVYYESTMIVPELPSPDWKTLFIWPGMSPIANPDGPNFNPIGLGLLQPVLAYGSSCLPNPNNIPETGWYISAAYVNNDSPAPYYKGCFGGKRMPVNPHDRLRLILELIPGTTTWRQTIMGPMDTITYDVDLQGQAQGWASFVMETPGGWHPDSIPSWTVRNIILRTDGNGMARGFCHFDPVLLSQAETPGSSLDCTSPVVEGNECRISRCSFNSMGK